MDLISIDTPTSSKSSTDNIDLKTKVSLRPIAQKISESKALKIIINLTLGLQLLSICRTGYPMSPRNYMFGQTINGINTICLLFEVICKIIGNGRSKYWERLNKNKDSTRHNLYVVIISLLDHFFQFLWS